MVLPLILIFTLLLEPTLIPAAETKVSVVRNSAAVTLGAFTTHVSASAAILPPQCVTSAFSFAFNNASSFFDRSERWSR